MSKWEIAGHITWALHVTWTYAFVVRIVLRGIGRRVPRIANRVFFEVRPLVPMLLVGRYVIAAVTNGVNGIGWRMVFLALDIAVYVMARREKDDDDRWKKRLNALSDKVSDLGHRLVVVPGGSS